MSWHHHGTIASKRAVTSEHPSADIQAGLNSAVWSDLCPIESGNVVIRMATRLRIAVGLLFLLELSAPDTNARLRIIGLIMLSG